MRGPMSDPTHELILPPPLRAALLDEARRAGPEEVCGLLLGRRDAGRAEVVEVTHERNVAEDRARGFVIDPGCVVAAHDAAVRRGLAVLGTWHSHPGAAADTRLSTADVAAAWPGDVLVVAAGAALGAYTVEAGEARVVTLREA